MVESSKAILRLSWTLGPEVTFYKDGLKTLKSRYVGEGDLKMVDYH